MTDLEKRINYYLHALVAYNDIPGALELHKEQNTTFTRVQIMELIRSLVPDERNNIEIFQSAYHGDKALGWNECRKEILRRMSITPS